MFTCSLLLLSLQAKSQTCNTATDIYAAYGKHDSIKIHWKPGGSANTYQVQYDTTGFTPGTGMMKKGITDTMTMIDGLNADVAYDFYVRTVCGPGDTSSWSEPYSVYTSVTSCSVNDTINDGGCFIGDTNVIPLRVTGIDADSLGTDAVLDAVEVIIDAPRYNDLDELSVKLESPSGKQLVLSSFIGDDGHYGDPSTCPGDPARFTMDADAKLYSNLNSIVGAYQPQDSFATIYDDTDPNGIWKLIVCDNDLNKVSTLTYASIQVTANQAPRHLMARGAAGDSIIMSWTPGRLPADSYELQYDTTGFVVGNGRMVRNLTDTTAAITGLSSGTAYDVYARQIKGEDSSRWNGP